MTNDIIYFQTSTQTERSDILQLFDIRIFDITAMGHDILHVVFKSNFDLAKNVIISTR